MNKDCLIEKRVYSFDQLKYWAITEFNLKTNTDITHVDLGTPHEIYYWFYKDEYVEWSHMKYLETKLILFGSNYFGVYPNEAIKEGMYELAQSIIKNFVGIGVSEENIMYNVESAMNCIDTYELRPNKTIRFIKNPYYEGEPANINEILGESKRGKTKLLIREYLEDYDYNQQGNMKYNKISDALNISLITVKRYMKEDQELKDIYNIVKKSIIKG